MKLEITSAKITGTPGVSGWCQVHEFKPEDPEKLAKRGQLFAVIATQKKEEGVEGVVAGRELLTRLHEEYFGNLEATAFMALKNSLQKVAKEFTESWGNIEVAAVVLVGEVVYSAAVGGSKVEIYRQGNLAKILESESLEAISASGYPEEGDVLILGTKLFFESLPMGVIKASLEGPDLSSSIEYLAPSIHSKPDSTEIGAVFIKFSRRSGKVGFEVLVKGLKLKSKFDFAKAQKFIQRVLRRIEKVLPDRRIYVRSNGLDEGLSKGRKSTFYVGTILLALLLVSIGFGIKQNLNKKYRASYEGKLIQAKNELSEAKSILGADSKRARELFLESKATVDSLISQKISDKEITVLDKEIKEEESAILGIYRESPQLYLDLSLLSSGFKGDKLVASGKTIYVFDRDGKRVVGIDVATKKTRVVAGPEQLDGITEIAAYEDQVFGIDADGVFTLGEKKEKVIEKEWVGEVIPNAYAGNIYLVDKNASVIWRYVGTNGKFGARTNWLAPGIKIDFSQVTSVAIDGSFWLLFKPFKITRLSLGSPQKFVISGVPQELSTAVALYSDEEQKYLYVLDANQKRVVVLDKTGGYQAEYLADGLGEATGIIVSEKEGKMIILTGTKLYSIELKHLI